MNKILKFLLILSILNYVGCDFRSYAKEIPIYPNAVKVDPIELKGHVTVQRNNPDLPPPESAFRTDDSLESVKNFYVERFSKDGWSKWTGKDLHPAEKPSLRLSYSKGNTLVDVLGDRVDGKSEIIILNDED